MKAGTCLIVDLWEGNLDIDEAALKAGGVAGLGIRLNDMVGGHHMDTNFLAQWAQAINFVRFPYFVYNPWVTGQANFDWLAAHIPSDAKSVAADIEVVYHGYSAATYAAEVAKFINLCKAKWKTIIYTGAWFLPNLSSWPKNVDYWWAQYPLPSIYFSDVTTWAGLQKDLDSLVLPFNFSSIPGTLKLWQVGETFKLPGTNDRTVDANIFYGSESDLAAYFGNAPVVPPPPPAPEPVVVITKVENAAGPIPEVLRITYVVNDAIKTTILDQTPDPDPDPVPDPVPVPSNPYRVTIAAWQRMRGQKVPPDGGPYTQPCTRSTNASGMPKPGDNMNLLDAKWQSYVHSFNTEQAWDKICAPDYGPSQGFNGTGKLKYLGLIYPGENTVKVLEQRVGTDGQTWGRIDSIPMDIPALFYTPLGQPWLFHIVYNFGGIDIICPILGGPWWVPMQSLEK